MLRMLLVFFCATLFPSVAASQAWQDYKATIQHELKSVKCSFAPIYSIQDDRLFSKFQLSIHSVENLFNSKTDNDRCGVLNVKVIIKNYELSLNESRFWAGKLIADILIDSDNSEIQDEKTSIIVSDIFDRKSLFSNSPKEKNVSKWELELAKSGYDKICHIISGYNQKKAVGRTVVTAFGHCSVAVEGYEDIAIKSALREAVENANGVFVKSNSTMKNFGDIEDIVKLQGEGYVVDYQILEEYTKKTLDNHFCVVVRGVIEGGKL